MISATLEYRDFVGAWTIAIKFAHIKFNGNEEVAQLLNKLCDLISRERNNEQNSKINYLESKQQSNNEKIEALKNQILNLKNKYQLTIFHKEIYAKIKSMKKEIANLIMANNNIDYALNTYEYLKNKNVNKLIHKYRDLLAKLGFSCKTSYHKDNNDVDVEIYEYDGDEEKLAQKAQILIDKLNTKLEQERRNIEEKFENFTEEQFLKTDIFCL